MARTRFDPEQAKRLFPKACVGAGLPEPIREHRFHDVRKWRLDYAWPAHRVALEVDGGVFVGGRHTRGSGWMKDAEKFNEVACLGWRVLRCTPRQLLSAETLDFVRRALAA